MTGATHARELISTSMNIYQMLKLLQKGEIEKNQDYSKMLDETNFYFIPILNVDGVNFIEENWVKTKKIVPQRKSRNHVNGNCLEKKNENGQSLTQLEASIEAGVDINRNFAIDFGQVDDIVNYQSGDSWLSDGANKKKGPDPCVYNYAGPSAFSEPESQAYKNFLTQHKNDVHFVLNVHSNGNAFIYPFNGRQKNDIEERRPGILQIFTQIAKEAPFPQGTMKGTSKEVMGIAIGGD